MTAPRSRTPNLFTPDAPLSSRESRSSSTPGKDPVWITAHCDGGARGNPGPAGYGAEITDSSGQVLAELSEFLGICTNNVAEYSGLLASLQYALDHHQPCLRVISDSELMVKQIQGKYKVNSPDLKPLWQEAKARIAKLERFEITHALRHKNKAADRLANEAMDRGMRRNTPAEGQPRIRASADPDTTPVASLPLRAIPYPRSAASPPPVSSDTTTRASGSSSLTLPGGSERTRANTDGSVPPPATQPPAMLRGFTRDGVIHLLGGHTLPEGRFVKIIPE